MVIIKYLKPILSKHKRIHHCHFWVWCELLNNIFGFDYSSERSYKELKLLAWLVHVTQSTCSNRKNASSLGIKLIISTAITQNQVCAKIYLQGFNTAAAYKFLCCGVIMSIKEYKIYWVSKVTNLQIERDVIKWSHTHTHTFERQFLIEGNEICEFLASVYIWGTG